MHKSYNTPRDPRLAGRLADRIGRTTPGSRTGPRLDRRASARVCTAPKLRRLDSRYSLASRCNKARRLAQAFLNPYPDRLHGGSGY